MPLDCNLAASWKILALIGSSFKKQRRLFKTAAVSKPLDCFFPAKDLVSILRISISERFFSLNCGDGYTRGREEIAEFRKNSRSVCIRF